MQSIFSYFGVFNTIISWKMDDIMCLELSLTRPKSHSEKAKVEHVNITAIKSQVSLNCWNNVFLPSSLSVLCVIGKLF